MYGRGMMGYAGGRRTMAPYWRPFPGRFMIGLMIGGLFLLFVAGPAFHFFPLLFLIWAVPFFVAPAFVAVARGLTELYGGPCAEGWDGDRGEQGAGASGGARAAWGAFARAGGAGDFAIGCRGESDALRSCQQRSR